MATLDIAYQRNHRKVNRTLGRASEYKCSCGETAIDWAHRHNTDPEDVQNYDPMCRSCHSKYDGNNRGSLCGTSVLVESDVIAIRAAKKAGRTQRSLAIEYGISEGQMSAIINRKAWAWLPDPT